MIRLEHRATSSAELLGPRREADQIAEEHADDLPPSRPTGRPGFRPSHTRDRSGRARDSPPHSSSTDACGDSSRDPIHPKMGRVRSPSSATRRSCSKSEDVACSSIRCSATPKLSRRSKTRRTSDRIHSFHCPAGRRARARPRRGAGHAPARRSFRRGRRADPPQGRARLLPAGGRRPASGAGLDARPVDRALDWDGLVIARTGGRARHGDDRGRAGARERLRPRRPLHRGRHDLVL